MLSEVRHSIRYERDLRNNVRIYRVFSATYSHDSAYKQDINPGS